MDDVIITHNCDAILRNIYSPSSRKEWVAQDVLLFCVFGQYVSICVRLIVILVYASALVFVTTYRAFSSLYICIWGGGGGYTETKPPRRSNFADFVTGA